MPDHLIRMAVLVSLSCLLATAARAQEPNPPKYSRVLGETVSTVYQWDDARLISDAPSLIRLPSGRLLCMVEMWGRQGAAEKIYGRKPCLAFVSDNDGKTWSETARLPFTSGKLLLIGDVIYFIGSGYDWQGLWITRSTDEGQSWSESVQLREGRTYAASTGWVIHDETLYWAIDSFRPSNATREVIAISADLNHDLLDAGNWRFSAGVRHPGVPQSFGRGQHDRGVWLEPNVIRAGDRLRVVVRVRISQRGKSAVVQGIAGICDLQDAEGSLNLRFSHYYAVPGAQNHFHIIYDQPSGLFWMLSNQVTGVAHDLYLGWGKERRILMLHYSADGLNWLTAGPAAVAPKARQAYNYCTPLIEGDDLLFVSRTALAAANQHDNDRITLHRVQNFRRLAGTVFPASSNARMIRVMPLGDSITRGSMGHPRYAPGGYRTPLYQLLSRQGIQVEFVGSQQTNSDPGNLPDKDHEGHKGFRIDQIDAHVDQWLSTGRPDVVLLLIGANDANQDYRLSTASRRMENLVKKILAHDCSPHLIVAQVPGSTEQRVDKAIVALNQATVKLVRRLAAERASIETVDLYNQMKYPDDFANFLHPNEEGYQKIAKAWAKAILIGPAAKRLQDARMQAAP